MYANLLEPANKEDNEPNNNEYCANAVAIVSCERGDDAGNDCKETTPLPSSTRSSDLEVLLWRWSSAFAASYGCSTVRAGCSLVRNFFAALRT